MPLFDLYFLHCDCMHMETVSLLCFHSRCLYFQRYSMFDIMQATAFDFACVYRTNKEVHVCVTSPRMFKTVDGNVVDVFVVFFFKCLVCEDL